MLSLSARFRFPQYTRASFQLAAGIQAPPWNPAYPIKDWFDAAAVPGVDSSYQVFDGSDTLPALITLTIPGAEAMTVNLPGSPSFEPYVVAPTAATKQIHFDGLEFAPQKVDPGTLSTLTDARRLAGIAGMVAVVDPTEGSNQFLTFTWNGETRRPYVLMPIGAGGDPTTGGQNVGQILASMNKAGVASPGHWSAAQLALHQLAWVPETAPSGLDVTARVPEPMLLQPGERLASYQIGYIFSPVVLAAGETLPGAAAVAAAAGDGFMEADRVKLTAVYDAIQKATAAA